MPWAYCKPAFCRVSDAGSQKGVCSTWGFGHYNTFDSFMYEFPGTCNYVFASECKNTFPLFNVQLKRASSGNIERILVDLPSINIQVLNGAIKVGSLQ